jgi:hypothetical protein
MLRTIRFKNVMLSNENEFEQNFSSSVLVFQYIARAAPCQVSALGVSHFLHKSNRISAKFSPHHRSGLRRCHRQRAAVPMRFARARQMKRSSRRLIVFCTLVLPSDQQIMPKNA